MSTKRWRIVAALSALLVVGGVAVGTNETAQCTAHMTRGNIVAADMALVEAVDVAWSICT